MARSAGNGEYAVIVDPASSLPGRGAWLHPELQCAQQAVRRRAFTKALRIDRPPDTSAVVEHLRALEPPGREQVAKNMSTP
ncbi:YlxR family protein [Mycobacterium rhizamassiliense]|uniref:YlxR family protein n=1 Tax=Mycobacterium rhizamassiliense TaxID=1841860 RepID=UPI003183CF41